MQTSFKEDLRFLKRHYNKSTRNHFIQKTARGAAVSLFRALLLIGLAFVIVYPIIIKLSTSLKPMNEFYDPTVFVVPKQPTLVHFQDMMAYLDFFKTLGTSTLFALVCGVLQAASCVLVAYGIARFQFKGRGLVFTAAIVTLVIPPQAVLLPLYIQFRFFNPLSVFQFASIPEGVNLINTPFPFLLLSLTALGFKNGLFIYMFRQYFKNMPYVLEEAAYIDGCGPYRTFAKIMIPGAVPLIATVLLFSFVWQFTDGYYSTILTPNFKILSVMAREAGYQLAQLKLENTNTLRIDLYNNVMTFLLMLPLLILYVFTQKLFVQSIEKSGIVG